MTEKTYAVGIDFGTSNSAISLSRPEDDTISSLEITQVASPGTLEERRVLPSAIYINAEGEFNPGTLAVPWSEDKNPSTVTGSFARERGSQVPERLVSSAKSWLCNDHVNRRDAILPWRSQIGEEKISPFGAAIQILDHIRSSLLYNSPEDFELAKAKVVLTVPASFDEVARALTFNAAIAAGFGEVTLLEEPQAAFYSWLAERKDKWSEEVTPDDIILVCDVGGGTADFSLITVTTESGILGLERISVGEHILLGGDNMDLALAIALKEQFSSEGNEIDEWQFQSLVHASRMAKEKLFSEPDLNELNISVAGRGSSLFSQSLSTRLTREIMESVILDGFVPQTEISEMPVDRKDSALHEFGLPYAADPVLSKHLASFLVESLENVRSDPKLSKLMESKLNLKDARCIIPTAILFNGGVFKADAIRKRVLALIENWSEEPIRELSSSNYDLAVAQGAAYYGRVTLDGDGLKIKSGTARSHYIGLESSMPAVPGFKAPVKGLCVVPQGTEEGSQLQVDNQEFGLVTGQKAQFRFFSSTTRAGDLVGDFIANPEEELEESATLQVELPPLSAKPGEMIPVKLSPLVNELGMLELWMKHTQSEQKWKLEYDLRAKS